MKGQHGTGMAFEESSVHTDVLLTMKLNRTPLHGTERNPESFHALLDAGADPTIQLDVGFPSLFQEASRRGDPIVSESSTVLVHSS